MDQLLDFTGRFHPLFVHLPIGILLMAVVFVWLNELGKVVVSDEVIRLTLAIGALSAIASVITGLLLADGGDYDEEAVGAHKYVGVALGIASIGLLLSSGALLKWGSLVVMMLIFWTGHLGGTITHGEGYLLASDGGDSGPPFDLAELDLDTAAFYNDAVEPVLAARCYSCHGESKQKGGLRLDNPQLIKKGGKNGKVLEAGNPEESELIRRINLPADDEDHMPPKEKRQLGDQEKKLISLWIASGADFSKKISELLDEKQLKDLTTTNETTETFELPDADVPPPDEAVIASLIEQGVAITPVAAGSNFLQVNFVSVPNEVPALLPILKPIAANVVFLKLTDTEPVSGMQDFKNLVDLNLSGSQVTGTMIDEIVQCSHLERLNLSNTKVTEEIIGRLRKSKSLKKLNLYNTPVRSAELPGVEIEFGGYEVPTLESDTTVVKTN